MPIKKSSVKDVRRTARRRVRNVAVISRLRTAVKKVREAKTPEEATLAYNAAARNKSRLALAVNKKKAAAK